MSALQQFQLLEKVWKNFSNPIQYYYQIGPFTICLAFAQASLAKKMTLAFQHLQIKPSNAPDLTIHLWDTVESKQKLPILDWKLIHRNGHRGHSEDSVYFHYFDHIDALSVLSIPHHQAFYVVKDVQALPWWVGGSPVQIILHWWLREKGLQLTHAAAIGNDHSAILLTGKGGSGKSTTTLACLREGLNYLSEDYCILELATQPKVYSLYQSAKWEPHTRKLFPDYEDFIVNPETANQEKALVYYQDFFPTQIKTVLPIKATISLSVGNTLQPSLKKYDYSFALKDLMMSTLMQLPLYQSETITILKNVASQLDHYQLNLGADVSANVQLIKEIF